MAAALEDKELSAEAEAVRRPPNSALRGVSRWLGAIGITLGPLGLAVAPGLMQTETYETSEEQLRAFAEGSVSGYPGVGVQISGAVFLIVAALGIGGFTIARGRGRTLGAIGLITGLAAGTALLLILGAELAMLTVVTSAVDKDAAVTLAAAAVDAPAFYIPLTVGLVGFYLTLFILGFALWRSRVVPIVAPLLLTLPLLIGFVPLPAIVASIVPGLLLILPCVWMSVQLIRGDSATPIHRPTR